MEKEPEIDTKKLVQQWLEAAKQKPDPEQEERIALKELAPTDLVW